LLLATYGGWLLIVLAFRLVAGSRIPFAVILPVFVANSFVLFVWLTRRTYLNREVLVGDAGLDERLVQNRNQAFRRAYQLFAFAVLLGWPLSWAAMQLEPGSGYMDAFLIYSAVSILGLTLPTVIWAWREPDPAGPEPA
jgi:hypothetical protein